ncbi:MAG TPA: hypothetical protein VNW49_17345, partial [Puia sp.]|nr:hypothetical protein [Puia sp.]
LQMIKPTEMTTLSQVIEKLRLKRQDNEFILTPQGFTIGNGKFYQPQDLKIIKTFRFEGESDPSDSSILYVMEANDGSIGYSVDAYGAFSNHDDVDYNGFIVKVPIEEREEKLLFAE